VVENFKDSIGSSLAELFIKSDNSGRLVPIQVPAKISFLDKAIIETRNNIRPHTPIREIDLGYADLLHYAAVVTCQISATRDPLPNRIELQQQIKELSGPALEWKVLATSKICSDPYECVQKRRDYVQTLLNAEDARDVKLSAANEAFSDILSWPDAPSFLQAWGVTPFDILPYEDILARLRAIERGIAGARAKREASAAESWSGAIKIQPQMEGRLKSVESVVNSSAIPWSSLANAISECSTVVELIRAINGKAKVASELDGRYSEEYGKLKNVLQVKMDLTSSLYEKAVRTASGYPATRWQEKSGKKYPSKLTETQL